ncbi:MAG: hypothetical protein JWO31_3556 [Phycisphaerales bacterium]|nr:hypothetical protein [Phycisphaerales bacterium]
MDELNQRVAGRSLPLRAGPLARLALAAGVGSLATLAVAWGFWQHRELRACCGAVGVMLAALGSGAGLWAAVRMRSVRLLLSSLPVVVALVGWMWLTRQRFLTP